MYSDWTKAKVSFHLRRHSTQCNVNGKFPSSEGNEKTDFVMLCWNDTWWKANSKSSSISNSFISVWTDLHLNVFFGIPFLQIFRILRTPSLSVQTLHAIGWIKQTRNKVWQTDRQTDPEQWSILIYPCVRCRFEHVCLWARLLSVTPVLRLLHGTTTSLQLRSCTIDTRKCDVRFYTG